MTPRAPNRSVTTPTQPATAAQEAYYDALCDEVATRRELAGLIRQEAALQGQREMVDLVTRRMERAKTLPWWTRAAARIAVG